VGVPTGKWYRNFKKKPGAAPRKLRDANTIKLVGGKKCDVHISGTEERCVPKKII